jgi:hypothetical protein
MDLLFETLQHKGGNLIEIYICPKRPLLDKNPLFIDVLWDRELYGPAHLAGFPALSKQKHKFTEYYHKDMCYSYDMTNDAQTVTSQEVLAERVEGPFYVHLLKEDTLPTHRFPCTTDIHSTHVVEKMCYRINNRMVFVVENGNIIYLRYTHTDNVDTKKMQEDMTNALCAIRGQLGC